jgi:[ribosomal protein S5]-alanine N-acetyltransferase
MRTIRATRCTLEPQVEAHAAAMFEVLSDPAIYEFEGVPPPSVELLAAGYRRKETRSSTDGREKWLNWVVRLPSNELAGYVQATVLASGASLVGYEFASKHWRQGIGSASINAMLTELAESYTVHTFVAVLKSANYRSMGLLHHLGFSLGTTEDARTYEAEEDDTVLLKAAGPALPPHGRARGLDICST